MELKKDANFVSVSGGVTDDASLETQPFRINPTTYRLLTDTSISSAVISGGTIDFLSSGTVRVSGGSIQLTGYSPVIATGSIQLTGYSRISGGSITITNSGGTAMASVDAAGNLMVSLGTKLDSTNDSVTATGSIQLTGYSLINLAAGGSITALGGVAHDSADYGFPVKNGAKATTSLSGLTMVGNNDRTDLFAGVDGVQIVRPYSNLEDISSGTASLTSVGSVAVISAAGAGVKTYLTDVTVANSGTGTAILYLLDGAVNKWIIPAPPAGGATLHFTTPLPGTANAAWNVYTTVASTTLYVSLMGFRSRI